MSSPERGSLSDEFSSPEVRSSGIWPRGIVRVGGGGRIDVVVAAVVTVAAVDLDAGPDADVDVDVEVIETEVVEIRVEFEVGAGLPVDTRMGTGPTIDTGRVVNGIGGGRVDIEGGGERPIIVEMGRGSDMDVDDEEDDVDEDEEDELELEWVDGGEIVDRRGGGGRVPDILTGTAKLVFPLVVVIDGVWTVDDIIFVLGKLILFIEPVGDEPTATGGGNLLGGGRGGAPEASDADLFTTEGTVTILGNLGEVNGGLTLFARGLAGNFGGASPSPPPRLVCDSISVSVPELDDPPEAGDSTKVVP